MCDFSLKVGGLDTDDNMLTGRHTPDSRVSPCLLFPALALILIYVSEFGEVNSGVPVLGLKITPGLEFLPPPPHPFLLALCKPACFSFP